MRTSITYIDKQIGFLGGSITLESSNPNVIASNYSARTDVTLSIHNEIENLFKDKFYGDREVLSPFLLENLYLVTFLNEAHKHLSKVIPGSILFLELSSDFEIENWNTLFISIMNNFGYSDFDDKLQDFIINWMFNQDAQVRRLITIKEMC